MRLNVRRCCHLGCTATVEGWPPDHGWYKCHTGFMSHACPDHRAVWEEYDAADRRRDDERSEAYRRACEAVEERVGREFPPPPCPPRQSSLID